MPKIPYKPEPRPPRKREVYKPPSDPCSTCQGKGVLYQEEVKPENEIPCWVCNSTGEQLPAPPAGDLHSDGSSVPWSSYKDFVQQENQSMTWSGVDYNAIELRALAWLHDNP